MSSTSQDARYQHLRRQSSTSYAPQANLERSGAFVSMPLRDMSAEDRPLRSRSPSLEDLGDGYRGRTPDVHEYEERPEKYNTAYSSSPPPKHQFTAEPIPQADLVWFYQSKHQLRRLIMKCLVRWLLTAAVLGGLVGLFKGYQTKLLGRQGKHYYNALATALQIMLSLNFFEALKDVAKLLRFCFLSQPHSVRQLDLLMGAERLRDLALLGVLYFREVRHELRMRRKEKRRPSSSLIDKSLPKRPRRSIRTPLIGVIGVIFWLALNILAQVGVALINLVASLSPTNNPLPAQHTLVTKDEAATFGPTLDAFYQLDSLFTTTRFVSQELAAHDLGNVGSTFYGITDASDVADCAAMLTVGRDLESGPTPQAYCSDVDGNWVYSYFAYDEAESYFTYDSSPLYQYTYVSYGNCQTYTVVDVGGSSGQTVTYTDTNGSNVTLFVDSLGEQLTTYVYPGDAESECLESNPRCSKLFAVYEVFFPDDEEFGASVYSCEVTVHNVNHDNVPNSKWDLLDIPDEQANLAASSIALSGINSAGNVTVPAGYQFQRYTNDSYFSLFNNTYDSYAGTNMAQYALLSLAGQAYFNPSFPINGPAIEYGNQLQVEWSNLFILFGLIGGGQLLIFVAAIIIVQPYVVRDDSQLTVASMMRPLLERLGHSDQGTNLPGEEVAKRIAHRTDHQRFFYGVERARYKFDNVGEDTSLYRLGFMEEGQHPVVPRLKGWQEFKAYGSQNDGLYV